jgi:hypothetical protein
MQQGLSTHPAVCTIDGRPVAQFLETRLFIFRLLVTYAGIAFARPRRA